MTAPLPPNAIPLLAHPTRRRILRTFLDSPGRRRRSPVELARMYDMSVNDVAYHVRVLARDKGLRRCGTEPVRGATKHFYVLGSLVREHEEVILLLLAAETEGRDGTSS